MHQDQRNTPARVQVEVHHQMMTKQSESSFSSFISSSVTPAKRLTAQSNPARLRSLPLMPKLTFA